jgi:hypothetical protein
MAQDDAVSARQLFPLTSHSRHRCVYRCHWDVGWSSEHSRFESLEAQGFVFSTLSRPPFRSPRPHCVIQWVSGGDVKLAVLIHVLPSKVLSACLHSPTWYVRNVTEDPESLRNLPAVLGCEGEVSSTARDKSMPQNNLTGVLNLH